MGRGQKRVNRPDTRSSSKEGEATPIGGGDGHGPSLTPTRRRALSALAAAAVITMLGCARFPSGVGLDRMISDLDAALAKAPNGAAPNLTAISHQIQSDARALITSQEAFSTEFDHLSEDPDVSDDTLFRLVSEYEKERRVRRDKLLNLQDQLHEAVPEDLWPDLQEILARKARLISIKTGLRQG